MSPLSKAFSLFGLFISLGAFADLSSMKARIGEVVELKEQGAIGEQPDGYLGIRKESERAQAIVKAENQDRREEYMKRTKEQGQEIEILSKVLGEARIRNEKAGRFVKNLSGEWVKK